MSSTQQLSNILPNHSPGTVPSKRHSDQVEGISSEFQDVELEFHQNFTTAWESSEIPVKGN